MRIVGFREFLQLPDGTVYADFDPMIFSGLNVKRDSLKNSDESGRIYCNDFLYDSIHCAVESDSSGQRVDMMFDAMKDSSKSLSLDYDCTSRDGLYDAGHLFAVFEKQDVIGLIEKLQWALSKYEA